MTTYYIAQSDEDGTIGCEFSKAKAVRRLTDYYGKRASKVGTVLAVTLAVSTREATRLLLGNHGQYAATQKVVWPASAAAADATEQQP